MGILKIEKYPSHYDINRYKWLKRTAQKLSGNWRTVEMINELLEFILSVSDAIAIKDDEQKFFDCVHFKFIIVTDLAIACKTTVENLLLYAKQQVFSNITWLYQMDECVGHLMQKSLCDISFYKEHILPRSWFYLIIRPVYISNQAKQIDHQDLLRMSKYQDSNKKTVFNLQQIKKNLFHLLSKIATSRKINTEERRTALQTVKQLFGFQNESELIDLYNSNYLEGANKGNTPRWFESMCLVNLFQTLGFSKKYFMEQHLVEQESIFVLKKYDINLYFENCFYKTGNAKVQDQNKLKQTKVVTALNFFSKYIKKDAQLTQSDFLVCFLEAFNMIFPKYLDDEKHPAIFRQNVLFYFIRTVTLIYDQKLQSGPDGTQIFEDALIQKTLYVLRLAQKKDTVDMSIFCLQTFLNALGVQKTLTIFPQVFSLITNAYLNFEDQSVKIKRYCTKIFSYYIKDQKSKSSQIWSTIQFIFLKKLANDAKLGPIVTLVYQEIYPEEIEIEKSIRSLIKQISCSCEDIRNLNVQYILEILEQNDHDKIRKVLCRSDVIQSVYQCILDLKQDMDRVRSIEFGVICARVISLIGLCYQFVNDPIQLKANNQQTLKFDKKQIQEEQKGDEKLVTAQSERLNPITNQNYNIEVVDNTLELLAAPNLSKLPIEREQPVMFAKRLREIIQELSHLSEEKPKNFYFTQFLLSRFIKSNGGDDKKKNVRGDQIMTDALEVQMRNGDDTHEDHELKKAIQRADYLAKTVHRITGISKIKNEPGQVLVPYTESQQLQKLAIYLISKIEDDKWYQIFESCIPLLKKKNFQIVELVLPYLLYYVMRCQKEDDNFLPEQVSNYFNQILESNNTAHIELVLRLIEFFKITITQDKSRFKTYIEKDTKFRYVDKLFFLDIKTDTQDQNIKLFRQLLTQNITLRQDFLAVKKLEALIGKLDKNKKKLAAKKVKNLKRCLFNMEDSFRQAVQQSQNSFMVDMPDEDVVEVVSIQKQLMPEDHDNLIFNSIMKNLESDPIGNLIQDLNLKNQSVNPVKQLQSKLRLLFEKKKAIQHWQSNNWQLLLQWYGDFDIEDILTHGKQLPYLLPIDAQDKKQYFELILALIFAEYYKASQFLLKSNDQQISDPNFDRYMESLQKIKRFIEFLYFEFIFTLEAQQGESQSYYKLFMHVLYEIESTIYFIKDIFLKESDKVSEQLKREVNVHKRKYEKIYYEVDLNQYFEKLLGWFEERSQQMEVSNEFLVLLYSVRRAIFQMHDRENEFAFYLMKLAKLHRKSGQEVLLINQYFKECQKYASKIIDFEYQYTKYTLRMKNANEAYQYLHSKLEEIKDKCDHMQKQIGAAWMPKLVFQKAQLLELELLIKIEPRNEKIFESFANFVKSQNDEKWEKPNFLFAQYVDMLERNSISQHVSDQNDERRKRHIQRIYYYMRSVNLGHKYIWQSLPRALELWFEFQDDNTNKINTFMKQELMKLDCFKIATVLQILLSRFGHERKEVRDTIVQVLGKLAKEYPEQSAWWIFHFHFFEENQVRTAQTNNGQNQGKNQVRTRVDFAKDIINEIVKQNKDVGEIIMKSETLFGDLKKLSEKQPQKTNDTAMEMPRCLSQIQYISNLVMPTEDNLSPQLPPLKSRQTYLRALVQTTQPLESLNLDNLVPFKKKEQSADSNYPAYKPNPVKIQGFLPKITIFSSKERPKKIGILGSDGKVYNFLLKYDKVGDLRKEQRFIDFAILCNKMLQQDPDARQRGLRLRTYNIVPLSQKTGLIEWIQNTSTLKVIVNDAWKRQNIKGDMADIKALATKLQKGETHKEIWPEIKAQCRPVLGSWFAEHFPSPDLWYEARVNFVKSCAIWSMIGYVIGLGDRHGDNILIHNHTGEVTHVDFDCIFEKGAKLKVPEIVPFRLTANIMDAFGIFKEKGVFQKCSEVVLRVLRKNQKNILSFLDTFKHDPLIENNPNSLKIETKDALEVIERKLSGNITIVNSCALTVEEQVEQVILNAISEDNLSKMYIGWMPWL